jgi:hypothetical protein
MPPAPPAPPPLVEPPLVEPSLVPDDVPPSPQAAGRNTRTSDIPAVACRIRAVLRALDSVIDPPAPAASNDCCARFALRGAALE